MNETNALRQHIAQTINAAGGWLAFDRFMALALYTPGLGYYAHGSRKFGAMPQSGSDFVTAPELSPLFADSLATQLHQALQQTATNTVVEFGAGSGALALRLLQQLGDAVDSYAIVELSASLRERQRATIAQIPALATKVRWLDSLPTSIEAVVIGNEVLDAMPVQLLARKVGLWYERGVALAAHTPQQMFVYEDRPTLLRPPCAMDGAHDYLTEVHVQAEAFIRTLAESMQRGAAFFIDYGFPESEYYHLQRHMGTLVCHQAHHMDSDPLSDVGAKDITAHVNFTGIALAAQDAGLECLGYTSQGRFLINCGIEQHLAKASLAQRAMAHKLVAEHEMGELFKVIALGKGASWEPMGFSVGDRSHRL